MKGKHIAALALGTIIIVGGALAIAVVVAKNRGGSASEFKASMARQDAHDRACRESLGCELHGRCSASYAHIDDTDFDPTKFCHH
jgi:hypothetical protein